jgi:hypothetical protein
MGHLPVNHPLRPVYRLLGGLTGAYVLVFGIVGLTRTWGDALFARDSVWVLGLRTNLAFSILSVLFGAVIVLGNLGGGNAPHLVNLGAAGVFLVGGVSMMAFLQTDANFLNFSMSTVIVSLVFALLLLAAGLYTRAGTPQQAEAEEAFRHRQATVAHAP